MVASKGHCTFEIILTSDSEPHGPARVLFRNVPYHTVSPAIPAMLQSLLARTRITIIRVTTRKIRKAIIIIKEPMMQDY